MTRTIILLGLALVMAGVTAYLVRARIDATPVPGTVAAPETVPPTQVAVALVPLDPGTFLRTETQVSWKALPPSEVPPAAIVGDANTIKPYEGAVIRKAIRAGDPIPSTSVLRPDEGGFMSAVLKPDKRAISIAVTATTGNAGFIFPGDRVDVILSHQVVIDPTLNTKITVGETIAEDLRVLAVDQKASNVDNKAAPARTVTIEVTPRQAEVVNVGADMGRLTLSLRSLPDASGTAVAKPVGEPPYTLDSDVSHMVPTVSKSMQVQVTRGGQSSSTEVKP